MLPAIPECPIALPIATLSAWRDHELSERQTHQTQNHIRDCAACQRYLTSLEEAGQAIKRHTPPIDVRDAIWRHVRAAMTDLGGARKEAQNTLALTGVAAAAVLIALFAYVFVSFANKPAIRPVATVTPTVSASTLFTMLQAGDSTSAGSSSLVGYDAASGHVRFTNPISGFAYNQIAVTHDLVGVITSTNANTTLLVFDATGAQVRQIRLGSLGVQFLLASNDTFFVGGEDLASVTKATSTANAPSLQVTAFAADSGAQRWQQTLADAAPLAETFVSTGDTLVGEASNLAGSSQLVALDTKTGTRDWTLPFANGAYFDTGGDAVYVLSPVRSSSQTAPAGWSLAAYALTTGAARWNNQFSVDPSNTASGQQTSVQLISADPQGVYCVVTHSASNGTILHVTLNALGASDGAQRWSMPEDEVLVPTPASGQPSPVGNGQLYVATAQAGKSGTFPTIKLVGVDLTTGATHVSAPLAGAPLLAPVVTGASIYVAVQPRLPTGQLGNAAIVAFSTTGSALWQVQTTSAYIHQLVALP